MSNKEKGISNKEQGMLNYEVLFVLTSFNPDQIKCKAPNNSGLNYYLFTIIYYLFTIIYYLISIIYHLLSIIYYLSSIIYHLSSLIYHLSSITSIPIMLRFERPILWDSQLTSLVPGQFIQLNTDLRQIKSCHLFI